MKNVALILFSVALSIGSVSCSETEGASVDLRYFSMSSDGFNFNVVKVNGKRGIFRYTITDKEVNNLIIKTLPRDCVGTIEKPKLIPPEQPAYCDSHVKLWSYYGELSQEEYEVFSNLLKVEKRRHYFEEACRDGKGCLVDGEISEDYHIFRYNSLYLGEEYSSREITWESVEKIKDIQFRKLIQTILDFQAEKTKEYRKKNAEELEKLGINLN